MAYDLAPCAHCASPPDSGATGADDHEARIREDMALTILAELWRGGDPAATDLEAFTTTQVARHRAAATARAWHLHAELQAESC